ncbi:MAG: 2-amino-4-hydroxy-6-hydroxymethyldihydropteridine diphosphokinase [Gammaproteobacteria bacterium]|nr:2-amino-4-hydroxy-6-hydroxymethyldihydropteridine diphosphokinase [Gammaproteobacteria bacterium]
MRGPNRKHKLSHSKAYLSLGSNVSPEKNIQFALDQLRRIFGETVPSSTYLTKAVGFEGPDFLNLVVKIETDLDPATLIDQLHSIEEMTGRVTGTKAFNDRTLDIDVLIYDDCINLDLNIPRDEILKHGFVLEPLAELYPDGLHPIEKITFLELWNRLKDDLDASQKI